jgi:hypothetical protein
MRSLASQKERGKTKQFIFVVYRYNRRLGTNNIGFKKRVQDITEIRMVREFKAIYSKEKYFRNNGGLQTHKETISKCRGLHREATVVRVECSRTVQYIKGIVSKLSLGKYYSTDKWIGADNF